MIREKLNGLLTLKDVVYWVVIVGALIGPYMFHERRLADISVDIAILKVQVSEINKKLDIRLPMPELSGMAEQTANDVLE